MKKCVVLMILVAVTLVTGAASAAMVEVSPATGQAAVNDEVTIDIVVSGLENTDLAGFDFDLSYDSSVLTFVDYMLTDELGDIESDEAWDLSPVEQEDGTVDLALVSLLEDDLSSQSSNFSAATIVFNAAAEGVSDLVLSFVDLSDADGLAITAEVSDGSVTVVPEPASLLLSLTGLVLLRRNRS